MVNFLKRAFGGSAPAAPAENAAAAPLNADLFPVLQPETPTLDVNAMANYVGGVSQQYTGEKFPGGFGATKLYELDYYELRARSKQLFHDNLYARGLVRRFVTNEINTGLSLEAMPVESIIEVPEDSLQDWTEDVEKRFALYGKNKKLCDYRGLNTLGALQREIRQTAIVSGDVLIVLRPDKSTGLPKIQLVPGESIVTPWDYDPGKGNEVVHGVEMNSKREHIAFHVQQKDGTTKRLAAKGRRTGRTVAWLYTGTEKLIDGTRGEPLLSLVLQSLKEIDRYRDSAQRKAVLNSILAMFIKKTEDKPSTLPVTGGMVKKGEVTVQGPTAPTRKLGLGAQMPGVIMEELQVGEEPVGFGSQGTDTNFPAFEAAIVNAMAWAYEMPPEILTLSFQSNYSASQAAINEFKIYLNKIRTDVGESVCQPIYVEWLLSSVLTRKINAPGLLDAWRAVSQYDKFSAWVFADWSGAIKPSTDIKKQGQGYDILLAQGSITHDRAARELTGTKFTANVKRLAQENALLVEAARPIAEFKKEYGEQIAREALQSANGAGPNASIAPEIDENDS